MARLTKQVCAVCWVLGDEHSALRQHHEIGMEVLWGGRLCIIANRDPAIIFAPSTAEKNAVLQCPALRVNIFSKQPVDMKLTARVSNRI